MRINNCADLARFGPFYVPILAKAFSGKQECPKKGHAASDPGRRLHPLKTAKAVFRKQECPVLGLS
jgi:hypothetical protein